MAKKTQEEHDYLIPELKLTQVSDIRYERLPVIKNSGDAANVLSTYIAQKDLLTQISVNEFAFVLYLNKQNRVIGITNLSIGGLDATLMDVRMVYSMAVKIGASAIITAHNHPSQNLRPSEADIKMSSLISQGGKTLSIQTLDFMIITSSSGYYSFADEGMMAQGGMFAKGGITEHGLRVGDTIVEELDENTIIVENPASGRRTINISTGHAMAKGGYMADGGVIEPQKPIDKMNQLELMEFVKKIAPLKNFYPRTIIGGRVQAKKLYDEYLDRKKGAMAKGGYIISGKDEDGFVYILDENGKRVADSKIPSDIGYGKVKNKFVYTKAKYDPTMGRRDAEIIISKMNETYAKGGRIGFKALSEKVASNYEGKSVPAKYRPEYGTRYDKEEAKEVGNKVAAKVYRLQQGK